MMDVYTSYIHQTEEVKYIKDISKPDKVSVRNVDVVVSESNTPTMILRKGLHEKEKIPFNFVSEYRTSPSLDIIEVRSDIGPSAFIRIKSRESLERWLVYLQTFLPPSDNDYEIPDACRNRSMTNTVDNRRNPRRTPRTSGGVQSVVDMEPTTFGQPVSTRHLLDTLHDEEGYDIVACENYSRPATDISDRDYSSLRSTDDTSSDGYYEEPGESQTVVNVSVIHNRFKKDGPPIPPKRGSSLKTQEGPWVDPANTKENPHMRELKGALQRKSSSKPKPPLRTNIRQTDSEIVEVAECKEEEDVTGGLYVKHVRHTSGRSSGGPGLTPNKAEVTRRRNHTEKRREDVERKREGTVIEDSLLSSSCSPGDKEDPTLQNQTLPPEIYAENARLAMKCEMENTQGITCHAELGQLQSLGIVTTQYGACINDVPANLQRKFYHGDKIISINEQRIKDATFARCIIETSQLTMVKVTVCRLFKGHCIEIERESVGDSETLGFALHNGSEIMYISPGTMFAKQASVDVMAQKMCITHIEKKFLPLGTSTKEVNNAIKDAGHKFHIILQPVEFMKELTQQS